MWVVAWEWLRRSGGGDGVSVAELAKVIGRTGHLAVEVGSGVGWRVPCRVVDVRTSWGEVHYRVEFDGEGDPVWVVASRVRVEAVTA